MDYSVFENFLSVDRLAALLTLCVIFVNGWTDAPNAIAGCVCSGAIKMKNAVILAAICNFSGTAISCALFPAVAKNIFNETGITMPGAICASLLSVIILAIGAWAFGIPTSESHAIIASLIGASVACGQNFSVKLISLTVTGLIVSVVGGFIAGFFIYKRIKDKDISQKVSKNMQIVSAGIMALMHGAQDGQKFISILLLSTGINNAFNIPIQIILLCSVVMALGTATGGKKIIDKVGRQMVEIDSKMSISSDIAGGISLFLSTIMGMPVSTTHAKTASIMGCGYAGRGINKKAAQQMIAAWLITFPLCFIMGYLFTRIFC